MSNSPDDQKILTDFKSNFDAKLIEIQNHLTIAENALKELGNDMTKIETQNKLNKIFLKKNKLKKAFQEENKLVPKQKIQENVKRLQKELKTLNTNVKVYNQKLKLIKAKPVKVKNGFCIPKAVPNKLADFIEVPHGSALTGAEITRKVWKQLKNRGLTYENDRRVFRTDADVTKIFGVPTSVNDSVDHNDNNGFNFYNLQMYIANALKN